jgi:hypothetical protein
VEGSGNPQRFAGAIAHDQRMQPDALVKLFVQRRVDDVKARYPTGDGNHQNERQQLNRVLQRNPCPDRGNAQR